MQSMFLCPVCGGPLRREPHSLVCAKRHSFDVAAAGYTNLLPANRKHSRLPGDDNQMAAARSRFLDGGFYAPLRRQLCRLAVQAAPKAVLDSGCGEGYYTAGIYEALTQNAPVQMAGIDISKFALRRAAKRCPPVEFAVASAYHLPLAADSVDLLVNCFSPLGLDEFRRVLRPDRTFLYVVPGPRHLWQLKQVLYDTPYENTRQAIEYDGFVYEEIVPVEDTIRLQTPQQIADLFTMTPYYWKTPRAGREKLEQLQTLETLIQFDIHVLRRRKE